MAKARTSERILSPQWTIYKPRSAALSCLRLKLWAFSFVIMCAAVQGFLPTPGIPSKARQSTTQLFKKSGKKKKKAPSNTICVNRIARRNYEVVETMEAGISLQGTEVKSIRDGKMNIGDGFVRPDRNGRSCVLCNVHIGKHQMSGEYFQHEERRPRTLLVHKAQARRLLQQTERQGMTIVPLKAYFNDRNIIKFEIGLCRGKNAVDKRQDIKERESKRDSQRMVKNFRVM